MRNLILTIFLVLKALEENVVYFLSPTEIKNLNDVNKSEIIMLVTLAFFVLFFGFYPLPLMETFNVSVNTLINNYETALISN